RTTESAASVANGFMITSWVRFLSLTGNPCGRLASPFASVQVRSASGAQPSAATPEIVPWDRITQPAETQPPKYSTYVEASGESAGTSRRSSLPGGTTEESAPAGLSAPSSVTRMWTGLGPGLATASVAFQSFVPSGPPPWGQNHAPEVAVPPTGAASAFGPTRRWR